MKFVRTIAFVLWVAVTALDLYIELDPRFVVNVPVKLGFAAAFVALWSIVFPPTRRHMGKWLAVLFVYYVWMLLNILFFDNAFGREQMHYGINLEPFHTIRNYLRAYELGNIHLKFVVINLVGNLVAFAPMGFFLPSLFRSQRNLLVFWITILLMVGAVELVQYVTHTGSCDIDDLLLNTAGALVIWFVLLPWRLYTRYKEDHR